MDTADFHCFTRSRYERISIHHSRPAGALVRAAKAYTSKITISCGEKSAQLTRLMAVMGLGIKQGQTVTVTIDGSDEDKAFEELQTQFRENA